MLIRAINRTFGEFILQYADAWPIEPPQGLDAKDLYDLKIPQRIVEGAKRKIVFVFEYVPTEDLHSGKLLGGVTGKLFQKLVSQFSDSLGAWSWVAINFNAWRTFGRSPGFVESSNEAFAKRVRSFIRRVKPTHVVFLGANGMRYLIPYLDEKGYFEHNIFGVPLPMSPTDSSMGNITLVPSLHTVVSDADPHGNGPSNLLGYITRCLYNGVAGKNPYDLNWEKLKPTFKYNRIESVKQFDGMMKLMREAPAVSVDTETTGLGRVTARLLTAQFCFQGDTAWFLPIFHKDTPFSKSELRYVNGTLRAWLEGKNKNRYHIYANAKFDLGQFKNNLNVRWFKNRVWDVLHAEYCFHPNTLVEAEQGLTPIEALHVGDKVWSFNHETRRRELKPLVGVSKHETKEQMYAIGYDEAGQVCVTGTHKVWSNDRGSYVEAQHLRVGEDVELFKPSTPTAEAALEVSSADSQCGLRRL